MLRLFPSKTESLTCAARPVHSLLLCLHRRGLSLKPAARGAWHCGNEQRASRVERSGSPAWLGGHLRHKRRHRLLLRGRPLVGRRVVGHAGWQRPGRVHRVGVRGRQLNVQLAGAPLRRAPAAQRLHTCTHSTRGWDTGWFDVQPQSAPLRPGARYSASATPKLTSPSKDTACQRECRQARLPMTSSSASLQQHSWTTFPANNQTCVAAEQADGASRQAGSVLRSAVVAGAHLLAQSRCGHVGPSPRALRAAGAGQRCLQRGQKVRKQRVTSAGLATPCRLPK